LKRNEGQIGKGQGENIREKCATFLLLLPLGLVLVEINFGLAVEEQGKTDEPGLRARVDKYEEDIPPSPFPFILVMAIEVDAVPRGCFCGAKFGKNIKKRNIASAGYAVDWLGDKK
jgi:hypothetical protein